MSSVTELWEEFDKLEVERYHISDKVYFLEEISRVSTNTDEKERVQFETNLLYFMQTIGQLMERFDSFDKKRIEYEIFQFVGLCSEKTSEYYKKCYTTTQNIFDKWRYAFCYWIIRKDSSFLTNSLDCLLKCIEKCFQQKNYQEYIFLLVKAFNISRFYNVISTYKEKIVKNALQLIDAVKQTEHSVQMIITPVKLINLNKESVSSEKANELILLLHLEANLSRKRNDHIRCRLFLEASLGLCNLLDLADAEKTKLKKIIQMMIAKSYVEEANTRLDQDSASLATFCYQHAIEEYRKIDEQAKIEDIIQKIRSINSKVLAEMDVIETKIEVPAIQFTATNGYDLVKQIVDYTKRLIPSRNDISTKVKQDLTQNPLPRAVGNAATIGTKNPVSFDEYEESIINSYIIRELNLYSLLADHRIASSVQKREDAKKISSKAYIKFLSDCGLDESLRKLIAHGIKRHFEKDYISSIHVLIPQVEATLRYLLNKKGINTLKTKGDTIMDNELGGLLKDTATRNLLGEDLTTYLELRFTEQEGMNLRNNVSHGLLDHTAFIYVESLATIRAILVLAALLAK